MYFYDIHSNYLGDTIWDLENRRSGPEFIHLRGHDPSSEDLEGSAYTPLSLNGQPCWLLSFDTDLKIPQNPCLISYYL